ncbi:MAG: ABC transporter ATP-binding protein/permease [Deltaproteobacteria bacterium]|jgi:ABC-type multidrug transport system fused ATPase/permease subunit|nr:ABC transporter ATP-binding protein/permease [Deltaproteobacteria bacterium]
MLRLIWPHKLPGLFWRAIVQDSLRIYRVLPKRQKLLYWFVFFLQVSTAVTETLTLLVLSLFAMSVASPEAAMNHFMIRPLLELFPPVAEFVSSPRRMVGFTSSIMIFFVCLKGILTIFTNYMTSAFSERVAHFVAKEASKQYLRKSYYWHISSKSGEVVHKILCRVALSQLTVQLLSLYTNIICCVFLFTSLFIAQPKMTVVVLFCFSVSSLALYTIIRHSLDKAGQIHANTSVEENMTMVAMTKGIREIITYNQQKTAFRKMSDSVEKGIKARIFLGFSYTIPSLIMECVGFCTIGGMVIYMLARHIPMEQIVAAASILMLTAWRILPIVTRSLSYSVAIRGTKPKGMMCLELLETFTKEGSPPVVAPDQDFRFQESLALKDAFFHYPETEQEIIRGVNLTIKKGDNIGLIGPSGAGKSTLALLLSGLVAPTKGLFEVDGRVLEPASQAAYLLKIGFVPQNPLLMEGTLADNVAFSKWGQDYDREEVLKACKLAAMDFVTNDPESLDMPLGGSSGRSLSGGESQRVAIARAFFTRPEVIIFDEATSALDQANEGTIRNTINFVKGQVTSIIIAHRLTTVEDCDLIFWLESGKIKMSGTPSEIIPLYEESFSQPEGEGLPPSQVRQDQDF